ncbi:MAG: 16S rRNA (cytosine(1402)-N(4))-methyltransferase RsmH [Candidatus Dojkabacteria bacterium]
MKHITVLKKETIDLISPRNGGVYADLTLGGGGHLKELLSRAENMTVLAFDVDASNIDAIKKDLSTFTIYDLRITNYEKKSKIENRKSEIILINDNFSKIDFYIEKLDLGELDGVIADLGWSTDQLDSVEGMSYEDRDSELDMRMDKSLGVKASDLLNALGKNELNEMFKKYADIFGSQNSKLVEEIKAHRKKRLIITVGDFLKIIDRSFGLDSGDQKLKSRKFQTYSKIFQALRIAVNNEFGNLTEILSKSFNSLKENGVFAILTFHSGEDKIVSTYFDQLVSNKSAEYLNEKDKYLRPSVDELLANISSRSAKLWAIKKL